jgi:hypothetical protein
MILSYGDSVMQDVIRLLVAVGRIELPTYGL